MLQRRPLSAQSEPVGPSAVGRPSSARSSVSRTRETSPEGAASVGGGEGTRRGSVLSTGVRSAQETVCGARIAAHWGVDGERGCLSTHKLASQVLSRYKTDRLGRSSVLGLLAKQLEKYQGLQVAWAEQREAARLAVEEAQREIELKESRISQVERETREAVESYQQKLGMMYKSMAKEVDAMTAAKVDKENLLAESQQRVSEQTQMVEQMNQRNEALRTTLDKTMNKLNDVQTAFAQRSQEHFEHSSLADRRSEQTPEMLRALSRVTNLSAAKTAVERDLGLIQTEAENTKNDLERERAHSLRLEAFIRKIAISPASSVRTGGGYILDSKAKKEAAMLIREASKLGAPEMMGGEKPAPGVNSCPAGF